MKRNNNNLILIIILVMSFLPISAQEEKAKSKSDFPVLNGLYLGQKLPGEIPVIFAPGIVSSKNMPHSPLAVSSDGKEIAWYELGDESSNNPQCKLFSSRQIGTSWSKPVFFLFNDDETINDLYFSSDNNLNCLAFLYNSTSKEYFYTVYTFERSTLGWNKPSPVKSENSQLYRNTCQNEDFIIFPASQEGGFGGEDLYIKFRKDDGSWTKERNLGKKINTKWNDHYPSLSPDGNFLFFVKGSNLYWVSTKFIETLRLKTKN